VGCRCPRDRGRGARPVSSAAPAGTGARLAPAPPSRGRNGNGRRLFRGPAADAPRSWGRCARRGARRRGYGRDMGGVGRHRGRPPRSPSRGGERRWSPKRLGERGTGRGASTGAHRGGGRAPFASTAPATALPVASHRAGAGTRSRRPPPPGTSVGWRSGESATASRAARQPLEPEIQDELANGAERAGCVPLRPQRETLCV
jgi:hypothetical protein